VIDGPDITADWLEGVLRASTHDVHVRAVDVEKIGTGQTGATYRLHLDADGLPPTLVAKTAAGDRSARERVAAGYRSEVGFYTVFRARVHIRTPRCWYAAISDDHCDFVLLLDDLKRARPGVQAEGCTIAQAADAVRNLAGLHAPTWNDRKLFDHRDWLSSMTGPRTEFLGTITQNAAEVFVDRYATELDDTDADTLRHAAAATARWGAIDTGVLTLVHGDYGSTTSCSRTRTTATACSRSTGRRSRSRPPAVISATSSPPASTSTTGVNTRPRCSPSTSTSCDAWVSPTAPSSSARWSTASVCCRHR
jgi:hypothetical protein